MNIEQQDQSRLLYDGLQTFSSLLIDRTYRTNEGHPAKLKFSKLRKVLWMTFREFRPIIKIFDPMCLRSESLLVKMETILGALEKKVISGDRGYLPLAKQLFDLRGHVDVITEVYFGK